MDEQAAGFAAWMTMMRVHQQIQQRVIDLMALHGLTLAQFDVLLRLHYEEGITQQQLADRMLVTKGNMTGLIDRMERQGWVERRADEQDRRSHLLYLTESGRSKIIEILPQHKNQIWDLMNLLSPGQQKNLLELLQQLENLLKTKTEN